MIGGVGVIVIKVRSWQFINNNGIMEPAPPPPPPVLQLRDFVRMDDHAAIPRGLAYPGAETLLLSRSPEMVRALLGGTPLVDLPLRLRELERSTKTFVFQTVYNMVVGVGQRIELWNPRTEILTWLLQQEGAAQNIHLSAESGGLKVTKLKSESRVRIELFTRAARVARLPDDVIVHVLQYSSEPFAERELRGLLLVL